MNDRGDGGPKIRYLDAALEEFNLGIESQDHVAPLFTMRIAHTLKEANFH